MRREPEHEVRFAHGPKPLRFSAAAQGARSLFGSLRIAKLGACRAAPLETMRSEPCRGSPCAAAEKRRSPGRERSELQQLTRAACLSEA